jgi:chaperone modulatory protein CbpM
MNHHQDFRLDITALSRTCRCPAELIVALVHEGAIEPQGDSRDDWSFDAAEMQRAQRAVRLAHDLELDAPAVALALQLLDEIERLRAALAARG